MRRDFEQLAPAGRVAFHAVHDISDQLTRALASISLNLAEGRGREGQDKRHHWRIARAYVEVVSTWVGEDIRNGLLDSRPLAHALFDLALDRGALVLGEDPAQARGCEVVLGRLRDRDPRVRALEVHLLPLGEAP